MERRFFAAHWRMQTIPNGGHMGYTPQDVPTTLAAGCRMTNQPPTPNDKFINKINAFCKKNRLSPSAFGILALHDPAFVPRLLKKPDAKVKDTTKAKVQSFMDAYDPATQICPECGQRLSWHRQLARQSNPKRKTP